MTLEDELARPAWQLPPGVPRGAWDYAHESPIATSYDAFHAGHPLLDLDRGIVLETADALRARSPDRIPIAIDLGCGTGRSILPLAERGWRTVGVDLSPSMLRCVAQKRTEFDEGKDRIGLIQANMAQLAFLADSSIDLALCLYSSLGMVQGRQHRRAMLAHVARALRPGGKLIVHAHNRGIWIRDPGGVRRWIGDRWRSLRDSRWEFGDRVYAYRGLPSMFLHIYSEREMRRDLQSASLTVDRWLRLNLTSSGPLRYPWFASGLRAGGFLAVATRS